MKEIVNLPDLSKRLRALAGWFGVAPSSLTKEGRINCAKACEQAANEIDAQLASHARFDYKHCEIVENDASVQLWFVVGLLGKYYPTKMVAEQAARITFPDDKDPYQRVYYSYAHFYNEGD